MQKVIIRADGNSRIGLGHIYRSLALTEILRNDFDCRFATRETDTSVRNLILGYCNEIIQIHGINVYDKPGQIIAGEEMPFDLDEIMCDKEMIITDGHFFGYEYQRSVKQKGSKLACIVDDSNEKFFCDLIINHGDGAHRNYIAEKNTRILTGFKYLMVRKEFLEAAKKQKKISNPDTVFICMGGADPFNITIKIFQACSEMDFIKNIIIVTGSAYCNKTGLEKIMSKNRRKKNITHKENQSAQNMIELLAISAIAICPASTIAMEICCCKAGVLTGTVIENQFGIHDQLVKSGCCISLNDFNKASIADIKRKLDEFRNIDILNFMMQKQAQCIDGLSGERTLTEFKALAAC